LKPSASSLEIVDRFVGDFQSPTEREGFGRVVAVQQGESLWSAPLVDIIG
jgi:hypothetical protein